MIPPRSMSLEHALELLGEAGGGGGDLGLLVVSGHIDIEFERTYCVVQACAIAQWRKSRQVSATLSLLAMDVITEDTSMQMALFGLVDLDACLSFVTIEPRINLPVLEYLELINNVRGR